MSSDPSINNSESGSWYDILTTEDGTGIDAGALAAFVAGIISTALGTSWASALSAIWSTWIVEPLDQIGGFLGELTSFSPAGVALSTATTEAETFVESLGPVAFLGALVMVIVIAYAAVSGWSLRG